MIDLLTKLKDDINKLNVFCEIQSDTDEILPDVRITPNSESWTIDNLGNRKSKDVNFDINIYINSSCYEKDIKKGEILIETINDLINSYNICNINNCEINYETIEDRLLVNIKASYDVVIYKRR